MPQDASYPESEDNYSDAAMPDSEGTEKETAPKEETDSPRGLLPKSILAGKDFKPGEEIVLKIVAIHDDEVEVEYSYGDEKKPSAPEKSEPAEPPSEMSAMME